MMRYEKALRMQVCYAIMATELPSESKEAETVSVKDIFDLAKYRYEKRKEKLEDILNKIKEKIYFAKNISIVSNDSFVLDFEEVYNTKNSGSYVGNYDGIEYGLVMEKGKIKLSIYVNDISKVQRYRGGEVYFENGVLERIYNGGKTWIRKILAEIKEEIMEIGDYLNKDNFVKEFYINSISNSFSINISPEYFSITDITSELMMMHKSPKNFEIDYFFSQDYIGDEFKNKCTKISTIEGEFLIYNASRRIKNLLNYRTRTEDEDVDLLLEFIKNLRVYESDVPEFLLK